MIGAPQWLMAAALAACASGIAGYAYGFKVGRTAEIASQARADKAAAKARETQQSRINTAASTAQSAEYQRQTNVREIRHESVQIVEKPVYRHMCLDADGVRLLDRAQAIANGEAGPAPDDPAAALASGAAQP